MSLLKNGSPYNQDDVERKVEKSQEIYWVIIIFMESIKRFKYLVFIYFGSKSIEFSKVIIFNRKLA